MKNGETRAEQAWFVYIVCTATGMLYTGISTDPERRLHEHAGTRKGSRSLRGKGPLRLVFCFPAGDRSAAGRLEARIKRLPRKDKLRLLDGELDPAMLQQ